MLDTYQHYLQTIGKRPNTVKAYLTDLKDFAAWFADTTGEAFQPHLVDPTEIIEYRGYLIRAGRKPKTINRRMVSLQRYFKWATQTDLTPANPFDTLEGYRVKEPWQPAPKWLEHKEQLALLRAVRKGGNTRDLALVHVLLRTGVRVSELVNLTLDDVEISARAGQVRVRDGKSGAREIPLSNDVRRSLEVYLAARAKEKNEEKNEEKNPRLFLGQRGPLQEPGVQYLVAKYAYAARLENVSPHTLRHTFAKNLVDVNTPLDQVAALLGDKTMEAVRVYTTPSRKDLEKAVRRASGELGGEE